MKRGNQVEKLRIVGKLEDHTLKFKKESKPAELTYIFVSLFNDEHLTSVNNHAIGTLEIPTEWGLARFKDVALIDPDFIAFSRVGDVLVFEDMEMIIVDNLKAQLCDECIEEEGY